MSDGNLRLKHLDLDLGEGGEDVDSESLKERVLRRAHKRGLFASLSTRLQYRGCNPYWAVAVGTHRT